jgi:phospholipase C
MGFVMSRIPLACFVLLVLLLGLSGCGGGSGSSAYTLSAAALSPNSITAGSNSTSTVTVTPGSGFNGTVTLSCGMINGGSGSAPQCSFNPSSLTVAGTSSTSTLTVSTSKNTPGGSYSISVTGSDSNGAGPGNGPQPLQLTTAAVIQRVVVIFQENRTPDNLFQDPVLIGRGADIASSGVNSKGQTIPLAPIDLGTLGSNPQNYDLGHSHPSFVAMYDGGKMDGADLIKCTPAANCPPNANPNPQFKYVKPADVQPYFAVAEQYTFGDRMFQTNQGPSFPAHQFIIAGTSAPTAASDLFAAENMTLAGDAGCIAEPSQTVVMIGPEGNEAKWTPEFPCFEHQTLTDLLDENGLTWRYYAPSPGSIWSGPDAIDHICQEKTVNGVPTCTGPDWVNNVVIPEAQVLTDIANGKLADVTWVIPNGTESDHSDLSDGSGPSWVASIVNAIGNSSYWANTAIIITWDDWGGWYDHVVPKVIDDGVSWGSGYVYGFRVPLIVVSPYAKAQYISHTDHDFGSVLKFIETTFNLPSLNYADARADDMSDCFDMTQSPTTFQKIAAPLNAQHFIEDKSPRTGPDDD